MECAHAWSKDSFETRKSGVSSCKSTVIPMLITISSEKSGKDNVATRHNTTVYPMTKPRRRNGSTWMLITLIAAVYHQCSMGHGWRGEGGLWIIMMMMCLCVNIKGKSRGESKMLKKTSSLPHALAADRKLCSACMNKAWPKTKHELLPHLRSFKYRMTRIKLYRRCTHLHL